jgi:Undecaprenyl-phosphate galactose phosphotransferase WbaP
MQAKAQTAPVSKTSAVPDLRTAYKPWLVGAVLLLTDLAAIVIAFLAAYFLRKALIPVMGGTVSRAQMQPLAIMILFLVPLILLFSGSYPGHGREEFVEFRGLCLDTSLAYLVVGLASFIFGYGFQFSRVVFMLSGGFTLVLLVVTRFVVRNWAPSIAWWSIPAAVIGKFGDVCDALVSLQDSRRLGLKPVVALVLGSLPAEHAICGVPAFEFSSAVLPALKKQGLVLAVVASPTADLDYENRRRIGDLGTFFPRLLYVAQDRALNVVNMNQLLLVGRPTFEVHNKLLSPSRRLIKRAHDLAFCLLGSIVGAPAFALMALAIALDSPGHVIYKQKRVGLNGKLFDMYKFRTMQLGAEEALDAMLAGNPKLQDEYAARHKIEYDPRITRVGRILRRWSLDEFPQFWNVIRGEMSVVGPRPYLPSETAMLGDACDVILRVAPGLTGWWQVMGRHRLEFKERLRMDEFYVGNYSMLTDLYILFKTVYVVISGEGI